MHILPGKFIANANLSFILIGQIAFNPYYWQRTEIYFYIVFAVPCHSQVETICQNYFIIDLRADHNILCFFVLLLNDFCVR